MLFYRLGKEINNWKKEVKNIIQLGYTPLKIIKLNNIDLQKRLRQKKCSEDEKIASSSFENISDKNYFYFVLNRIIT